MAKREYHNLRGLVRDMQRALREGDYSEVTALVDLIDDIADARVGIAEDASGDGPDDGLDLPDQSGLPGLVGSPQGHDTMLPQDVDIQARLADAVERLTRLESSNGRVPRDAAHLAVPGLGRRLVGGLKATT